ncbi:T9SS type A sorting domain-containing protein, partial [Lutimonas halocynthiae]|uniref:T9SS type A sorting domain-containing protein n=1 Tax=Lutimonas halocynthiae TaxID=1446477 RepID=UPI0025B39304
GATTQSITVSPSSTRDYTVTATINGCEDTDSVRVTVNTNDISAPTETIANAGEPMTICLGESITLTGSGGNTFRWDTGETSQMITVSPKRTTTYTLEVTNQGLTSVDTVIITVENCSNDISEETSMNSSISVYPNPSSGVLNIKIDNLEENSELLINDMKGSIIYMDDLNLSKFNTITKQIDLSRYSKGIYFVRFNNSRQQIIKKFILI